MLSDIEVHIDFASGLKRVGILHRQARRGSEATSFEYHPDWLGNAARFSLEPALTLTRGASAPAGGATIFGSIGDSAPDTWGRRLMQRVERRRAEREGPGTGGRLHRNPHSGGSGAIWRWISSIGQNPASYRTALVWRECRRCRSRVEAPSCLHAVGAADQ